MGRSAFVQSVKRVMSSRSSEIEGLLKRTKVIDSIEECYELTKRIIANDRVVGIDAEAVQGPPGLVQVATESEQVYLLRTGLNSQLLCKGGIKSLLEHKDIVKVLHDGRGDNLSFAQAGIKMQTMFDTSIAYNFIQYQEEGKPYVNNLISFNNICAKFQLPTNPLKCEFEGHNWIKTENKFFRAKPLPEDLVIYCAYDVVPLIELYRITSRMISSDFQAGFEAFCENALIKPFDKKLCQLRQKQQVRDMDNGLFLSQLKDGSNKYEIYEYLAQFEGFKKILMHKNCAHVILEDRKTAEQVLQDLELRNPFALTALGDDFSVKWVRDAASTEASSPLSSSSEGTVNEDHCRVLVSQLVRAKASILVQFNPFHEDKSAWKMEISVGQRARLIFDLTNDAIIEALAPLMQSPDVTKVVTRLSVREGYEPMALFKMHGFQVENVFDIDSAVRLCNYFYHGCELISSSHSTTRTLCQNYGIVVYPNKKDIELSLYYHVKSILPLSLVPIMRILTESALEIADKKAARDKRRELQKIYDKSCLHVKVTRPFSGLSKAVAKCLSRSKMEHHLLVKSAQVVVVKIVDSENLERCLSLLRDELSVNADVEVRQVAVRKDFNAGPDEVNNSEALKNARHQSRLALSDVGFDFDAT